MTKTTRTVSDICERLRLVADCEEVHRLESCLAEADKDMAAGMAMHWANEVLEFRDARKAVQKQLDKRKRLLAAVKK